MKALKIFFFVLIVAVVFVAMTMGQPSLEDWAHNAPLERVAVSPVQTITGLIQARVPEGVRAQGDMTEAVSIIEARQDRQLGKIGAWEEILLPEPYAEWHK